MVLSFAESHPLCNAYQVIGNPLKEQTHTSKIRYQHIKQGYMEVLLVNEEFVYGFLFFLLILVLPDTGQQLLKPY